MTTKTTSPVTENTCGPVSLDRFRDETVGHYTNTGSIPTTLSKVRRVFRILSELGVTETADLNDAVVARFEVAVQELGARNRLGLLGMLRTFCKRACSVGYLGYMPRFPKIPAPRDMPKERQTAGLRKEDVRRFRDHYRARANDTWKAQRLYTLFSVFRLAGTRHRETIRLKVKDIDLDARTMQIKPRDESRWSTPSPISIPDALATVLAAWLPRTGCEWLFPGDRLVGPWTAAGIHLRAAGLAIGIKGMSAESLHCFFEENARTVKAVSPQTRTASITQPGPGRGRTTRPSDRSRILTIPEATQAMVWLRERAASWEGHRLYVTTAMVLLAGLQRRDLLAFVVDHINPAYTEIRVPQRPPVLLSLDAAEVLKEWIGRPDRGGTPFVIPGVALKGPWFGGLQADKLDGQLYKAFREAGIQGTVMLKTLRRLWTSCGGRVELGRAWRETKTPPPILTGPPPPAPPGPKPTGRSPRKKPHKVLTVLEESLDWDPTLRPAIVLGGPKESVLVFGTVMEPLGVGAYGPIKMLLERWPKRCSLYEMSDKFGDGWRKTLRILRKRYDIYNRAIVFPGGGRPGQSEGYGVATWSG